ncbi:cytochrome P450 81E8-like [Syzygium oleosum]|uniref:cytochrome P450 81E8-like n=1 Tax=Syzygium oleosum TaxID=219896 RepID=UPI0024BAB8FC|nr:cytochrome P450 81E8-like [Syzygium oleosum]
MEASSPYTFLSLIFFLLLTLKLFSSWLKQPKNLPPSPPSIPILGHLHLIKLPLHRTLHSLSQSYGPVISLRFGSRRVVVISSAEAAKECCTENDLVLANRPTSFATKHLGYDSTVLTLASYGDHWRNLRRICTLEIFSSTRLNSFLPIRRDEIKRLLLTLNKRTSSSPGDFTKVELRSMFLEMIVNIVVRMMTGKRYYGEDVTNVEEARSFREMISEILQYTFGGVYPGDFLSILRLVFRDYEKNVSRLSKRLNEFLQNLIEEHRASSKKGGGRSTDTMVDHLLSLQETQPEYYTDEIIKGLTMVMVVGGTDTSTTTMEWAMSFLLSNPNSLKRAAEELDSVIGQECLIDETDIAKLPYLQNIVSETLRLKPPAPFLVPHMSSEDCTIGGYNVPRQTTVFINAWSIHRDPNLWDDATSFKPERFENGDDGQFKFLPFGRGRRACPGEDMAQRVINLALGSLIQCFEWKSISEEGINMPKGVQLEAMCKPRKIMARIAEH